ncbi:MAG: nucleotide sugar dehydrogenase [Fidelibacterota bacterium]
MDHSDLLRKKLMNKEISIAVIGLGYVGLPLAVEFGKNYITTGFDINKKRISELSLGKDKTLEVTPNQIHESKHLVFTSNKNDLQKAQVYIVTVPTPIDHNKAPDLRPIISASELVGSIISKGAVVVYESTVYPGCTEEVCVPILETTSGLKFNQDFFCGYSPERINPGDKEHTVTKIKKITSGSTPEIAQIVDDLYASIITAGTHRASSIKVAEAAKVIENTQRDINIAFMNELSMVFDKLGIDTYEVLEAAGTKWNFLPYRPGLVGGHCISVDPYYLAHKAESAGYHPDMILSGRRINDNMGREIASRVVKRMIHQGTVINSANVLILGFTFKENCPDIRNTRVIDVVNELREYGCNTTIFDPWADQEEVKHEYGETIISDWERISDTYSAVVIAVAHQDFINKDLTSLLKENGIIFDVKGIVVNPLHKKVSRL